MQNGNPDNHFIVKNLITYEQKTPKISGVFIVRSRIIEAPHQPKKHNNRHSSHKEGFNFLAFLIKYNEEVRNLC